MNNLFGRIVTITLIQNLPSFSSKQKLKQQNQTKKEWRICLVKGSKSLERTRVCWKIFPRKIKLLTLGATISWISVSTLEQKKFESENDKKNWVRNWHKLVIRNANRCSQILSCCLSAIGSVRFGIFSFTEIQFWESVSFYLNDGKLIRTKHQKTIKLPIYLADGTLGKSKSQGVLILLPKT